MLVSMSTRAYLSISHFQSAKFLARKCTEYENMEGPINLNGPERSQHASYSISSVIISVAFLEATINEIFSDCTDDSGKLRISTIQEKDLMGKLWELGIPRTASYPILEKYDIALIQNKKEPF
ncbi:MAG: hypothetical protein ACXWT3_05655 [Methylococcaceae bacterium]